MGPIYSVDDFLDMVRRHLRLIIGLVILGSLVSLMVAANQQHMYRSSEVIQIEAPKIADELAPSTVAGSAARRLQLIQQQIMARGSLIEIIDQFNLFADLPGLTLSEKVNRLRENVRIDGQAAVREGFGDDGTISVLTVTATMPTAELAQTIASEFAARTMTLTTQAREMQTQATLEFFTRQEEQLLTELGQLEQRIVEFRAANDLALPGSIEFRREEIQTINAAILEIEGNLIAAQRRLDQVDPNARQATRDREIADLQAEIAGLAQQRDLLRERVQALSEGFETTPEIERALSGFEREMAQLQRQLDVMSTRRAEAEVGARLEARNNSEQLIVLEAAPLPEYPYTSSKKRLAIMGGVASVFAALAVAFLLDLRNPVLRTAAQMKRETGLTPVVSIPFLEAKSVKVSLLSKARYRLQDWRDARAARGN